MSFCVRLPCAGQNFGERNSPEEIRKTSLLDEMLDAFLDFGHHVKKRSAKQNTTAESQKHAHVLWRSKQINENKIQINKTN